MTLEPVEGQPGLWRDPDWAPAGGGTFAVIIGVSRYDHLRGKPETYGLDQLAVSALTAWRVFDWLRGAYRMAEAPVAEVRLLLAPTPEEIAFEPAMDEHRAEPDFHGCALAINAWYNAMAALPKAAALASRAVFFFSGHGLELTQEQQILLPSDYLRPDIPNVNWALSSLNLRKGLGDLAVWRQFYFFDACRNDHHRLRDQGVIGTSILNEPPAARTNPDLIAPVLHATATGAQAFQRKTPQEGLSLFGEALLDGLAGKPDLTLRPIDEAQAAIDIFPLQQFVKARVRTLLRLDPNNLKQPVRLSGNSIDDGPVTVINLPHTRNVIPGDSGSSDFQSDQSALQRHSKKIDNYNSDYYLNNYSNYSSKRDWIAIHPEHADFQIMPLSAGIWRPSGEALSRCEVRPMDEGFLLRFAFYDTEEAHWTEVGGSGGTVHGVLLPAANAVFRMAVDRDQEGSVTLPANLDPKTPDANLRRAAAVWELYQKGDLGEAIEEARALDLENLLRDKVNSPLAAAIAALLLIRVRRFDLLHHWTRNLSDWFPNLPDGAVIRAVHCLRVPGNNREAAVAEAAENLERLAERGIPYLAETFAYACSATETLSWEESLDPSVRERLGYLAAKLGVLRAYHRPDGLFNAFSFPDRAAAAVLHPAIGVDP